MTRQNGTTFVLLAMGILLVNCTAVAGEWDDEFPITQDPVIQYRLYPTVGPDDMLYVLWPDWTIWEDTKVMLMKRERRLP